MGVMGRSHTDLRLSKTLLTQEKIPAYEGENVQPKYFDTVETWEIASGIISDHHTIHFFQKKIIKKSNSLTIKWQW